MEKRERNAIIFWEVVNKGERIKNVARKFKLSPSVTRRIAIRQAYKNNPEFYNNLLKIVINRTYWGLRWMKEETPISCLKKHISPSINELTAFKNHFLF